MLKIGEPLEQMKLTNFVEEISILHLTHTYIPSDNRILKEIDALSKEPGYRLIGIGVSDQLGGESTAETIKAKIESISLWSRRLRFLPSVLRHALVLIELSIRLLYRGVRERPRVVHCHDTPVLLIGVLLKRLVGAKLVYDAHELESNKNGQSRLISRTTFFFEKLAWPFIDHFISVSPSIVDWYQCALGQKSCSLILNSPSYLELQPSNAVQYSGGRYFHQLYEIKDRILVFLYLGLLVPGRGVELMLEAFSASSIKAHIVFVGYGPLASHIKAVAQMNSKVHLHPPVPHEHVVCLSRNADFGLCMIQKVSLSDFFCLPNKLFEYAFAGIPVLASNFPDISRLVEEYQLGLCCNPEAVAIVEAIENLEIDLPPTMSTGLEHLGWQSQSTRLRNAYRILLRGAEEGECPIQ